MTNEAEEKPPTISDDLVVTKYKMAAEIVNREFESPLLKVTLVSGWAYDLIPGLLTKSTEC